MQSQSSDRSTLENSQAGEIYTNQTNHSLDGFSETTADWQEPEDISEGETASDLSNDEEELSKEHIWFGGEFVGCMDMYADIETVAEYFDDHQQWFRRCAHPMQAEPLAENEYALTIGRCGALGYQVEPKGGLELLPQDRGVYRIRTISIPN